jgi:outer membrane protein
LSLFLLFSRNRLIALVALSATALSSLSVSAETISGALAKAYQNNSSLNSARAGVRVTDEHVIIANSGWRPTVTGSAGIDHTNTSGAGAGRNTPPHNRVSRPTGR